MQEKKEVFNEWLMPILQEIPESKIKPMARFYLKKQCSNPREELLSTLWQAKIRDGDDQDLYSLFDIYKLGHLIDTEKDYNERVRAIFREIPDSKIKAMARVYLKRQCNNPLEELLQGLWEAKVRDGNDKDLRWLLKIYKFNHLQLPNSLLVSKQQPDNMNAFFSSSDSSFELEVAEEYLGEECACW